MTYLTGEEKEGSRQVSLNSLLSTKCNTLPSRPWTSAGFHLGKWNHHLPSCSGPRPNSVLDSSLFLITHSESETILCPLSSKITPCLSISLYPPVLESVSHATIPPLLAPPGPLKGIHHTEARMVFLKQSCYSFPPKQAMAYHGTK